MLICLTFFNLSLMQKTCFITYGNKANVCENVALQHRQSTCEAEQMGYFVPYYC